MLGYQCAFATTYGEGPAAAIGWCRERLSEGQFLTLWLPSEAHLDGHDLIGQLGRSSNVEVVTLRDRRYCAGGPVLAYGLVREHLGDAVNGVGITAFALVANEFFRTWNRETAAQVLVAPDEGHTSDGDKDPILSERAANQLRSMSRYLNLNNAFPGRYKDRVYATLRGLMGPSDGLTADTAMEWAAANGWCGGNVKRLADTVNKMRLNRSRC